MDFKYSIVNDDNDTVLGFCNEVNIRKADDECCSVLRLYDLKLTEKHRKLPTTTLSNFRLHILSLDGKNLGGYSFSPRNHFKLQFLETTQGPTDIEVRFSEAPLPFAFEVWNRLRERPNDPGQWHSCSHGEKQAWLQVLRLRCNKPQIDRKGQVLSVDGSIIQDEETFFIALGEAINGPFGYYGADLDGLADCLCGGFGLIPPFTLTWTNFHKSFNNGLLAHEKFIALLLHLLTSSGCDVHLTASSEKVKTMVDIKV
ncbi:barstar family protein [Cohnella hashimotonis]|uniref:Barstar family protein n=1 Tax=Cohnella hashimotonis TaxID=2826895 RepID=A0ABT6TM29_9BACL|nr:barstar family protein [Cohnella hashimotonis]MDI4647902.1 barstar family protein [Cohnella hashimotonis]